MLYYIWVFIEIITISLNMGYMILNESKLPSYNAWKFWISYLKLSWFIWLIFAVLFPKYRLSWEILGFCFQSFIHK